MLPYIHIFGLAIPTYTVLLMIAILTGVFVAYGLRKHRGIKKTDFSYAAIFTVIGGLIGAKLLFLIVNFREFIESGDLFGYILRSGIVFYGSVIGGAFALFLYCHKYRISFADFFDIIAPGVCFAQAIGRIGCFCAGCCYGEVCESPISVYYPEGGYAPSGVPVLPTQLMESAFLIILGFILLTVVLKSDRRGLPAAIYMLGYGVWRFIIEFFRSDPRGAYFGLSTSQWLSFVIVALGAVTLVLSIKGKLNRCERPTDIC